MWRRDRRVRGTNVKTRMIDNEKSKRDQNISLANTAYPQYAPSIRYVCIISWQIFLCNIYVHTYENAKIKISSQVQPRSVYNILVFYIFSKPFPQTSRGYTYMSDLIFVVVQYTMSYIIRHTLLFIIYCATLADPAVCMLNTYQSYTRVVIKIKIQLL